MGVPVSFFELGTTSFFYEVCCTINHGLEISSKLSILSFTSVNDLCVAGHELFDLLDSGPRRGDARAPPLPSRACF